MWGYYILFYNLHHRGLRVLGGKSVLNLQLIHNTFFRAAPGCLTINPYKPIIMLYAAQKTRNSRKQWAMRVRGKE